MNRTELVDTVASKTGLDKKQAEAAVAAVTESVMTETKAGNKVAIFGFGIFSPSSRAARMGRNPQTGAPVKIAASKGVRFAPASTYKEALNSRGKAAATKKAAPAKNAAATKKVAATKKAAPATKAAATKKVAATKKTAPATKAAPAKKALVVKKAAPATRTSAAKKAAPAKKSTKAAKKR